MKTAAMMAVENARANLAKAEQRLRDERSRRKVKCSCGKMHPLGKLELIVTHWYTEPHGCSGGDYWSEGEWQYNCPDTHVRNRFLFDDYDVEYEKRGSAGAEPTFKRLFRDAFASKKDVYDWRRENLDFFNNYYVDLHREKFELPEKKRATK